jgi:maleamate amidohydrolase
MARVWDRFLTEQDKAHLSARGDRRVGFGTRPAILNVDLFRSAFGDENLPLMEGTKLWNAYCGPVAWQAVPYIQKLHVAARAAGVPVLHVTGLPSEESGIPRWGDAVHRGTRNQPTDAGARERHARRFDIIDELAPLPGEVVLKKTAPSAFYGTPLQGELTRLGIDTLLIAGESTSGCVRASVVDAASARFRVAVIEECVFDRHETCHAMNLFDMNQKYADVISLAAALEYIGSWSKYASGSDGRKVAITG